MPKCPGPEGVFSLSPERQATGTPAHLRLSVALELEDNGPVGGHEAPGVLEESAALASGGRGEFESSAAEL